MSTCNLSTHEQYPLNSVQFDKATGKFAVHLSNPPQASCPDGYFTSKAATLTVDPNISVATLTYTNHPVVLVPSKGIVQEIDSTPPSSFPFGTLVVLALIGVAVYGYFKGWYSSWFNTPVPSTPTGSGPSGSSSTFTPNTSVSSSPNLVVAPSSAPAPAPIVGAGYRRGGTVNASRSAHYTGTAPAPVGQTVIQTVPQTVVVHDSGMGNFVGGMLVGQALSGGFDHHRDSVTTEVIHDREIVHDHDGNRGDNGRDNYRSDSDDSYKSDNTPRVSSDDDSSSRYSSDDSSSSSRYSSDDSSSSDSYSSDSSSSSDSYSSDSGSSDSFSSGD